MEAVSVLYASTHAAGTKILPLKAAFVPNELVATVGGVVALIVTSIVVSPLANACVPMEVQSAPIVTA